MKATGEGDATKDAIHGEGEVPVCATVARASRSLKNEVGLVSARFLTTNQNVFCRQTQRKQSKKGCPVHPYGCRLVLFLRLSAFILLTTQAGASGTGRTTFVNTLCESEVLAHKVSDNPGTAHIEEGIRIKPANVGTSVIHTPYFHCITRFSQSSRRMAFVLPLPSLILPVLATTLTMSSR